MRQSRLNGGTGQLIIAVSGALLLASVDASRAQAQTPTMLQVLEPLKLAYAPEIQAELGLDPRQVQSVDSDLEAVGLRLWQLRDLPSGAVGERELSLGRELRAGIERLLRPGQLARFDQLLLRSEGWRNLQLPSIVEKLQLDQRQRQSYQEFVSMMDKLPDKSPQSMSRHEFEWIQTTLTEPQRQKLRQLLGRPFDFSRLTIREVKAPELREVEEWINSPPLSLARLRGKVVVVNFWTFGCINCLHNLPHYRSWYASFPPDQVVQIGIHTPETAGEHDLTRLRQAVREKSLAYPVAVDNQRANWTAWGNDVWPAVYLVDKQGYVRYWWYGELNWQGATGEQQMRSRIQQLLAEPSPVLTTNRGPGTVASVPGAN